TGGGSGRNSQTPGPLASEPDRSEHSYRSPFGQAANSVAKGFMDDRRKRGREYSSSQHCLNIILHRHDGVSHHYSALLLNRGQQDRFSSGLRTTGRDQKCEPRSPPTPLSTVSLSRSFAHSQASW